MPVKFSKLVMVKAGRLISGPLPEPGSRTKRITDVHSARIPHSGSWQMGCSRCCPLVVRKTGKCSVVMPGHIGTSIPINSRKIQSGNQSDAMDATQIAQARARIASTGRDVSDLSDATRETRRKRSFGDKGQISVQTPKAIVEDARCLLSGGNVFHAIFVTERSSTLPIA